jgi:hypothetical protein
MEQVEEIDTSTYAGKAVKACRNKVRGVMDGELLTFSLLDFVSLMLLNNKFLDKGIVITDDNKEECYIKIIEMGEESLIDDLEKYINLKDSISIIETKKMEYKNLVKQLKTLSDYNDKNIVNNIVKEYLRK